MKKILLLILVLSFLGLIPRILRLDEPLLIFHAWRQCDTAAICRNIYRNDLDFLHPEIDYQGPRKRLVETECQIYGLTVALLYSIFGLEESLGRLVSLLCFYASIPFLLWISYQVSGQNSLVFCLFFYLFTPMSIVMSTSFQPDSMTLFFTVSALAMYWRFLQGGRRILAYFSALALALALLTKLSAAYIALAFLFTTIAYRKEGRLDSWNLSLGITIAVLPAIFWYSYASTFPNSFHLWSLGPQRIENWLGLLDPKYVQALKMHLLEFTVTFPVVPLVVLGAFSVMTRKRDKQRWILWGWTIGLLIYMSLTSKHMIAHSYYCLPILPLGSVFASVIPGKLLDSWAKYSSGILHKSLLTGIVVILLLQAYATFIGVYPKFYLPKDTARRILLLAERIKKETKRDELVVSSIDHGKPEILYYADRKGWALPFEKATRGALSKLYHQGARYYAFLQPKLKGVPATGQYKISLAGLLDYFHKKYYPLNYCLGEGYGYTSLLPLEGLIHAPKVGRKEDIVAREIFLHVRRSIVSGASPEELRKLLAIDAFLLPMLQFNQYQEQFGITKKLLLSPQWKLLHYSDRGMIFCHFESRVIAEENAPFYEYVDPSNRYGNFSQKDNVEACYEEAKRAYEEDPSSMSTTTILAHFASETKRYEEAYETLKNSSLFDFHPKSCILNMAVYSIKAGKHERAKKLLKDLLLLWPKEASAKNLLNRLEKKTPSS